MELPRGSTPPQDVPPPLPEGITLFEGGTLAELNFGNLEALINTEALLRYLASEKGCKDLCDQYEVWLTAQSLRQSLPEKFSEGVEGRRIYYVAHGTGRQALFDDKDPAAIASFLIEELKLQGTITEHIQIRLVGCYSAALVEDVVTRMRKSGVKLGEGGSLSVRGTIGTYFRRGQQSQMLTRNETGERQAAPLFSGSDQAIKKIFEGFKGVCDHLRKELVEQATKLLQDKDQFLMGFLGIKTPGQGKQKVAAWGKTQFGLGAIIDLLVRLRKASQKPAGQSEFLEYCLKLFRRFEELQRETLLSLLATRDELLTALFELRGEGTVAKHTHGRHQTAHLH